MIEVFRLKNKILQRILKYVWMIFFWKFYGESF